MKSISVLQSMLMVFFLAGCSVSHDVATDGWIQKRKHRTGFHVNVKRAPVHPKGDVAQKHAPDQWRMMKRVVSTGITRAIDENVEVELANKRAERPFSYENVAVRSVSKSGVIKLQSKQNTSVVWTQPRYDDETEEEGISMLMVGRALLALGALIAFLLPFYLIDLVAVPILPLIVGGILLAFILLYFAVLPDLKTKKDKILGILGVIKVFLPSILVILLLGAVIWFFASMFAF